MAKGDSSRAQNQINYQGGYAQNQLNNQLGRTQNLYGGMYNNYQNATGNNLANYDDIMNSYKNFQNNLGKFQLDPSNVNAAMNQYQNFANTGGFSNQDIQNIRARAIAPTRAIYQQGQDQLARQNALSGGLGTNVPAAIESLARQRNAAIGDANVNANASIAQMIQQGKLAGTQGLGALGLAQENQQMLANQIQNQLGLAGLGGQSSLYGATPGLANMFGNQVLNANNQSNYLSGLQNQLAQMIMSGQINKSQIPGDFQQALGNIGGVLGLGGQLGGMLSGLGGWGNWFGGGGGANAGGTGDAIWNI